MAGAVASLVAVAVGEDADTVALLEGVLEQPFERAPVGVDFDGAFDARVVRQRDVGVAAADVREDDGVLVLDGLEQRIGAVGVGVQVGQVVHQGVGRTVQRTAFVQVQHVAVAAQAGIARPFVAGEDHEAAGFVVAGGQGVQVLPEFLGDLEIVALVAHRVQEGAVAREQDELLGGVGADGLFRLAVQVGPVVVARRLRGDAARVAARHDPVAVQDFQAQVAGLGGDDAFDRVGIGAGGHFEGLGHPRHAQVAAQGVAALRLVGGVAPFVLALEAQAQRLAGQRQTGQHGLVPDRGPATTEIVGEASIST